LYICPNPGNIAEYKTAFVGSGLKAGSSGKGKGNESAEANTAATVESGTTTCASVESVRTV
jgi:hypothetical protein